MVTSYRESRVPFSRTITATVHGIEGSGKTKTEAKQDAIARLEAATAGTYEPLILHAGPFAVLIYRDLYGWNSMPIRDEKGWREKGGWGTHQSREEADRSMRRHLGQMVLDREEVWSEEDIHPVVLDAEDRRDLVRYAAWLRAYHAAPEGVDPHRWAGQHEGAFRTREPVGL